MSRDFGWSKLMESIADKRRRNVDPIRVRKIVPTLRTISLFCKTTDTIAHLSPPPGFERADLPHFPIVNIMATDAGSMVQQVPAELVQALAPRIQVIRHIGAGGMGAVYLARDPLLRRSVAVKLLAADLASDAIAHERFMREAEAAATVNHANVVSVYEVGELPSGRPYFVMEFIEGGNTGELLERDGVLSEGRGKRLIGEIAAALAAAHARGLVHRDIKPANVMIEAGSDRTVVLDFGISAVLDRQASSNPALTAQGTYIGTPKYTSPEQAAGDTLTGKSDVYSLGITAFELLTGKLPFLQENPMALMAAHMKDAPPKLRARRSDLDPAFSALMDRCLEKDPDDRPSASEIAAYLNPGTRALIEWPPPGLEALRGRGARFLNAFTLLQSVLLLFVLFLGTQPSRGAAGWHSYEHSVFWSTLANAMSGASPDDSAGGDATLAWFTIVALCLGASILIGSIVVSRGSKVLAALGHAKRSGYPLALLLGVALDGRRDTAQLVNGTGPAATIPLRVRERLLRLRRGRQLVLLLAPLCSVLAYVAWASGLHASSDRVDASVISSAELALILSPVVLGSLMYTLLWIREIRGLGSGQHSLWRPKATGSTPPELVRAWMLSASEALPVLGSPAPLGLMPVVVASLSVSIVALAASVLFLRADFAILTMAQYGAAQGVEILSAVAPRNHPPGPARQDSILDVAVRAVRTGTANDSVAMRTLIAGLYADALQRSSSRDSSTIPPDSSHGAKADHVIRTAGDPPPWPGKRAGRTVLDRLVSSNDISMPLADEDVRLLAQDTVTPWLQQWRRLAHSPALVPPFRFPGPAMVTNDAALRWWLNWRLVQGVSLRQSEAAYLALSAGRSAEAELRARETVSVGYQFLKSPLVDEESAGAELIRVGAGDLMRIAKTTRNTPLIEQAVRLQQAMDDRSRDTILWGKGEGARALMSDAGDPSPAGLALLRDPLLRPSTRMSMVAAAVEGFCLSPREILFGVSLGRLRMLDSAERLLADIPRANELVAANRRQLMDLIRDPVKSVQDDAAARHVPPRTHAPVWMGFGPMRARFLFCEE